MADALRIGLCIAVAAAVTALTRALPYLAFSGRRALPGWLRGLGEALPPAIIVILVLYCLRDTAFLRFPFGLPELISVALTAALQFWRRNAFLSVLLGTACYMLLTRAIF